MSSFSFDDLWETETKSHEQCAQRTKEQLKNDFEPVLNTCTQTIQNGKKILFIGNGGSAADAQHLATELTVRYVKDRPPIAAIALTTDTSTLTAAGNDIGFENIFARQISAIGNAGDTLIAISTSGNSQNIINALETAQEKQINTIGFSGRDGGKMKPMCDQCIIIPSNTTARIQEMHILIGHMLCAGLEQKLGLSS